MALTGAEIAAMIYYGSEFIGGVGDFFREGEDQERQEVQDQRNEAHYQQELGLKKEELALKGKTAEQLEKQRGFKRLIDLMGTGNTLMNQASGAARLGNLRNSGIGPKPTNLQNT